NKASAKTPRIDPPVAGLRGAPPTDAPGGPRARHPPPGGPPRPRRRRPAAARGGAAAGRPRGGGRGGGAGGGGRRTSVAGERRRRESLRAECGVARGGRGGHGIELRFLAVGMVCIRHGQGCQAEHQLNGQEAARAPPTTWTDSLSLSLSLSTGHATSNVERG